MPRPTALAACFTLLAIAAPAAWHAADAGIPTDGPALRPTAYAQAGGTLVTVELDRGVMMSGGRVKVLLSAAADSPRKLPFEIRVMREKYVGGKAPIEVTRRRVTVNTTPEGDKPTEAAFDLQAPDAKPGQAAWFYFEVAPVGKIPGSSEDEPDRSAEVGLAVWTGNTLPITVESPAKVPAGLTSFTVKVHVKNPFKQPLPYVNIDVGGPTIGYTHAEGVFVGVGDNYLGRSISRSGSDAPIAPGQERVYEYQVTPKSDDEKIGLLVLANTSLPIDEKKGTYSYYSAMEAISIAREQDAPAVPATKAAPAPAPAPASATKAKAKAKAK